MTNMFNNRQAVEFLVDSLKDRRLTPFPHIGVVGPNPHRLNTSTVFTDFTQIPPYLVGYKVEVCPEDNPKSVSSFEFTVRKALGDESKSFESFRISVENDLDAKTCRARALSLDSGEVIDVPIETECSPRRVTHSGTFCRQYVFAYEKNSLPTTQDWQLSVVIRKTIYTQDNGNLFVESRFINESKKTTISGDLPAGAADDEEIPPRIETGFLMDISLKEQLQGAKLVAGNGGTPVRRLFNLVATSAGSETEADFGDHYLGYERILKIKKSDRSIGDFISAFNDVHPDQNLSPLLAKVFSSVFRSATASFYKYQEEGISEIWQTICNRDDRVKVISVRTAGGKTETFMVPVLQYCLDRIDTVGTKALVFYPTKALANDQAKRIFKALYYANKELTSQGKRKITMALYHGDIEKHSRDEIGWVPFKCVNGACESPLEARNDGINNTLVCPVCGQEYDFVCLTRDESHRMLPDILITNPDTLTWVLSRSGERHSILGRSIRYCNKCGHTHKNIRARKCSQFDCTGVLSDVKPQCVPDLIVFDEVHLFSGAFGISVSQFLKRLIGMLRHYHRKVAPGDSYRPVFLASTATIKEPEDFASKFFGVSRDKVDVIPQSVRLEDVYEDVNQSEISRYNLFILPRAYLAKQTTALAVKFLLDYAKMQGAEFRPRILGFANSLRDCNDLISETRARYDGSYVIDGHNTQYSTDQRSDREVRFNRGEVSVLYATSTLEVGVDFEALHALVVFGPPYRFNDYLQRIGRAGRNSDAVVLTVVKMNNPVDYYYYENSHRLVNAPMSNIERVPINSHNPHIAKKQVISAFFDYVQKRDDAHELEDIASFNAAFFSGYYWRADAISRVTEYLQELFALDHHRLSDILDELKELILTQGEETPRRTLGDLFSYVASKTEFTNLRSSDPAVEVDYIFGG